MLRHRSHPLWTGVRTLPVFVVAIAVVAGTGVSVAFFGAVGTGVASAAVGGLGAPTAVAGTVSGSSVNLTWTAGSLPPGATLTGYVVTRNNGSGDVPACGSSLASPLPASPTSCTDTALPGGTYTFRVTAVLNSWTALSAPSPSVTVVPDVTPPTVTLAATSATGAWIGLSGGVPQLYFKQNAAGSVRIAATVTDTQSGPKSVTFPAVAATGWIHNAETVTSGTGSAPTITYTSSPWTWVAGASTPTTRTIVASDVANNTTNRTMTFRLDNTAPTGGVLAVNGTTASAGPTGNTSNNATGSFTIGTRTNYVEAQSATQSGLESSVLTRQFATYSGGACGAFGAATTIAGTAPIAQGPLPTGCYRYALTGTDRVGNAASRVTTVRVDTGAPVGGALSANGTAATLAGSTSNSTTGSWTLTRTEWTDPDSAVTSVLRRSTAPVTAGVCGTFGTTTVITGTPAQTGTPRNCYRYTLTGTNAAGLTSVITTTVVVGPFVTSVRLLNGPGIAGRATAGDTVEITYSEAMNPSTFCSLWSTSGDQSLTGNNQVTVSVNQGGGGDTLTVTATGCTFNFGSIALGSTGYTTATAAFVGAGIDRSTVVWTAATRTLTVTLGRTTSVALGTVVSSVATYSPSTAQLNPFGLAMGGSFATANIQQF